MTSKEIEKLSFLSIVKQFLDQVTALAKQLLADLEVEQEQRNEIIAILDSTDSFLTKAALLEKLADDLENKMLPPNSTFLSAKTQKASSTSVWDNLTTPVKKIVGAIASVASPNAKSSDIKSSSSSPMLPTPETISVIKTLSCAFRVVTEIQLFPLVQKIEIQQKVVSITNADIDAKIKTIIDAKVKPFKLLKSTVQDASMRPYFQSDKPRNEIMQLCALEVEFKKLDTEIVSFNSQIIGQEESSINDGNSESAEEAIAARIQTKINALEAYKKQHNELMKKRVALINTRVKLISELKLNMQADIVTSVDSSEIRSSLWQEKIKANKSSAPSTLASIQAAVKGLKESLNELNVLAKTGGKKELTSLVEFYRYACDFAQVTPTDIANEEDGELSLTSLSEQDKLLERVQSRLTACVAVAVRGVKRNLEEMFLSPIPEVNQNEISKIDAEIKKQKFQMLKAKLSASTAYRALKSRGAIRGVKTELINKYLDAIDNAENQDALYDAVHSDPEKKVEDKTIRMRDNTGTGFYRLQFWSNNGGQSTTDTLAIRLNIELIRLVKAANAEAVITDRNTQDTLAVPSNSSSPLPISPIYSSRAASSSSSLTSLSDESNCVARYAASC
jgi:hypothetical protein